MDSLRALELRIDSRGAIPLALAIFWGGVSYREVPRDRRRRLGTGLTLGNPSSEERTFGIPKFFNKSNNRPERDGHSNHPETSLLSLRPRLGPAQSPGSLLPGLPVSILLATSKAVAGEDSEDVPPAGIGTPGRLGPVRKQGSTIRPPSPPRKGRSPSTARPAFERERVDDPYPTWAEAPPGLGSRAWVPRRRSRRS